MRKLTSVIAAGLFTALFAAVPAQAHKVIASAYAEGDTIEGEVGFSNGDMATNTLVEVFDDTGRKLGETKTDADGFFSFTPTEKVIHVFRADLGAGHVAQYRMGVGELPESLGAIGGVISQAAASEAQATVADTTTTDLSKIETLVAEAVRKEVKPLRREIAAYKEKNDMQNILGGVGYIIGIFGVGFYLAARRQAGKAKA